ncbi:MAG: DUF3124 domain-containing protein [Lewinellaceae bacterium]|nr:DUF3124 domain-containing protein [Lewinellaceae bacterium]
MRQLAGAMILAVLLAACGQEKELSSLDPVNWEKRRITLSQPDSLSHGSTYLSIYSEIYDRNVQITHPLTATVSMRNKSSTDSVYIHRADYYSTDGRLIRTYFDHPIFIRPLETIEIVIDQSDKEGGTGANFIFEWSAQKGALEPFFEAVMISTTGQQGISFTTQGVKR